jgi:two-component system CAI-1 autoinducer sensor kinase/phosphatase CqsS
MIINLFRAAYLIVQRARNNYEQNYPYLIIKYKTIGYVGFIGFPSYYVIWQYIFKQPYENIYLRLLGSLLCFVIIKSKSLPVKFKFYMPAYTYVTVIYCLPFFFTFMLLANNGNIVWLLSHMASTIYMILLLDTLNVIICSIAGVSLAFGFYFINFANPSISVDVLYAIPVLLFILAGSALFNYSEERIRQESRMRALTAVGSSIAHEMRTPLLGIRYDANGLREYLPRLIDAHEWAVAHGWDGESLEPAEKDGLDRAMDRISHHTVFANTMINILLMNIGEQRIDPANFGTFSMAGEVTQLLGSYPFKGADREKIVWKLEGDFIFFGSDLLMRHVFFNLLKNGLRALGEARQGHIEIRLEPGQPFNQVYFRDTGTGIAEDQLSHLFEPFYTGLRDGTRVGIGLTFCQRVIESFEGTLTCQSELGKFTEFVISLPHVDPGPNNGGRIESATT